MVAYSFKKQFVEPIKVGLGLAPNDWERPRLDAKRQTIRARRVRHARPGEELQLFCGMRTKHCFLIGRARCIDIQQIKLDLSGLITINRNGFQRQDLLDAFARQDGFADFAAMRQFWIENHPGVGIFEGVLIKWDRLP